jgi:hypothetical protein
LAANETRTLTIAIADGVAGGTAAQQRSGVQSLGIMIDGEFVSSAQNAPSAVHDSQPLNYTWSISADPTVGAPDDGVQDPGIDETEPASPDPYESPEDLDPDSEGYSVDGDGTVTLDDGSHQIAVLALDWLGHLSATTFDVGPAYTDDQD